MAYDYYNLLTAARNWAEQGLEQGRLQQEQVQALFDIDSRSPDTLFVNQAAPMAGRPLIVAFMGGTGVGKSSLLNRLAGQAIARVGVERPTSREVTLYHYHAMTIQELPVALPLESIKIKQHHDSSHSHIVWIDMPDFDSIELGNQRMVLEWLPHIDVLLYVVSPERYRDNMAWQLLLSEGLKHAWLFVMNQWDRGQVVQFSDFKQQLHKAGFADPLVFRTSCTEPEGDDFSELLTQLTLLSQQQSIAELEQYTHQQRAQALKSVLLECQAELVARDFAKLQAFYSACWQKTEAGFLRGLAWPMQQLAKSWAEQLGQKPEQPLWDDWAQSRFNDVLDELVLQAADLSMPSKPLKLALQSIKNHTAKKVTQASELAVREALLQPGNGLQRFFMKTTALAETVLPLTAMAAVGYQVYYGYYQGASNSNSYLGVDFAVHSVLLIGLSWLIPFFIHKKIQPSLEKAAVRGLQKGVQQALVGLDLEIQEVLAKEQNFNRVLQQQLADLIAQCEPGISSRIEKQGLLGRVLLG